MSVVHMIFVTYDSVKLERSEREHVFAPTEEAEGVRLRIAQRVSMSQPSSKKAETGEYQIKMAHYENDIHTDGSDPCGNRYHSPFTTTIANHPCPPDDYGIAKE